MASVSISNQFLGTTLASVAPSCINSRLQHSRVSASYATTDRTFTSSYIASQASLYQVLGIPMGASLHEVKTSFRRLARVSHPDVAAANNGREDSAAAAADEFMRIHKAYTILSDPEKRADYDRTLIRERRVLNNSPRVVLSAGTRYSGYTRRTWETDQCW